MEDKIIRRIQSLLERATHPETPEGERETAYSKANELAQKFRIDMSKLNARENKERTPELRKFAIDYRFPYAESRKRMQQGILEHYGIQVVEWATDQLQGVGFEEDFTLADLMWTSVNLDFATKIMPAWNHDRDLAHNIFIQKNAAKSWMEIIKMAPPEAGLHKNSGNMMRKVYADECKRRGVEPMEHSRNPAKFRESFAEAYASTIRSRLYRMKREEQGMKDSDQEGALALIRDEDKVKQAFYEKFPYMRPATPEQREQWKAQAEARKRIEEERRSKLTPKQREAEDAKEARAAARQRAKWDREDARNQPDMDGWSAGHRAAASANLGGNSVGSSGSAKALS
ncbi:hypothetical protein [Nocardia phage P3.1]|nr:hypothetical protein [Nocardia phage P3.1]